MFPDLGNAQDIEIALVWAPPAGIWARLGGLKLIVSLGMGVDHLFRHEQPPAQVPIVRIVDPQLMEQMVEYVLLNVLRIHRQDDDYASQQQARQWQKLPPVPARQRRIGIMGFGEIGRLVAASLGRLGFSIAIWSRTAKSEAGYEGFAGAGQLAPFLARSDMLINVLALTEQTRGIVNARTLALLPRGAHFINIARGGHVVDADLLAAIDSGQIASATLDVFNHEPLPADHAYWRHKRVRLTPHVAGPTFAASSAPGVAENIRRLRAGQPLSELIDRQRGY